MTRMPRWRAEARSSNGRLAVGPIFGITRRRLPCEETAAGALTHSKKPGCKQRPSVEHRKTRQITQQRIEIHFSLTVRKNRPSGRGRFQAQERRSADCVTHGPAATTGPATERTETAAPDSSWPAPRNIVQAAAHVREPTRLDFSRRAFVSWRHRMESRKRSRRRMRRR